MARKRSTGFPALIDSSRRGAINGELLVVASFSQVESELHFKRVVCQNHPRVAPR